MSDLDLSLDDCLDLLGAGRNHKARLELEALRTAYATVQAEREAAKARIVQLEAEVGDILRVVREMSERMPELRAAHLAELATLRETLVGEVERMQRWDRVGPEDSYNDDWIIAHDSEGEYLYRSDVLRRIKGTK